MVVTEWNHGTKIMVLCLDRLACYKGTSVRWEQRKHLGSNHRQNRTTEKEDVVIYRCYKVSNRKRRDGCMSVGYSRPIAIRRMQCGMQTL
jgi:hypothetical protein